MAQSNAYSFEIRKKVEMLGRHINKETFISLLLIRQASEAYKPLNNQLELNDFVSYNNHPTVNQSTAWYLVANKSGGDYAAAITEAMKLLESQYPSSQTLIDTEKYGQVNESLLGEFISLLSEASPCNFSFSVFYEDYMRKEVREISQAHGDFYTPKEYSTVMGMLYMMTRMGTAKKVTSVFEDVMGKKPQSFRQFVKKNLGAWTV